MFTRNCPTCSKLLEYSSKDALNNAIKKSSICKSCSAQKQYQKDPMKNRGTNNGRYGKSLMETLITKYGDEQAVEKYTDWSKKLSSHGFKFGNLNPSYGKSPPLNSGKSYKGWYKNLFFRSVLELLFIFDYERQNNCLPISADSKDLRITYLFGSGEKTYIPDFYCPIKNTIYELKCSYFTSEPINIAKFSAAKLIYPSKGFVYKIISECDIENFPGFDSFISKLKTLNDNATIKLTDKSVVKLNNRLKITGDKNVRID